jgi:hypothetical protein
MRFFGHSQASHHPRWYISPFFFPLCSFFFSSLLFLCPVDRFDDKKGLIVTGMKPLVNNEVSYQVEKEKEKKKKKKNTFSQILFCCFCFRSKKRCAK